MTDSSQEERLRQIETNIRNRLAEGRSLTPQRPAELLHQRVNSLRIKQPSPE